MMAIKLSYLLPSYRAFYTSRLLGEIAKKTTLSYEFLIWLNLSDAGLESYIRTLIASGCPIRIVGKTPENIGMAAFKPMIEQAKGEMLVQLEDDVLFVSRRAGEIAGDIFARRPDIGMLSAEVWQDEFSNGGHPRPESYLCADARDQLYVGPIDGGFSVYPRSSIPLLLEAQFRIYMGLGCGMHFRLQAAKKTAYKCRRMRIFHLHGPHDHSIFAGMVNFEIAKYRRIGHSRLVALYEEQVKRLPPKDVLEKRFRAIERYHESFVG
jgi:hypothetical protein